MSKQTVAPNSSLTYGVIAGPVAALDASGAAPQWIKVTPVGRVKTRDGRSYSFDVAVLAARFAFSLPLMANCTRW